MKHYAIFRQTKIKSFGYGTPTGGKSKCNRGLDGSWAHDIRLIRVPNADPKKINLNGFISEETGWKFAGFNSEIAKKAGLKKPQFLSQKAQSVMKAHDITPGKDQVLVAALLLSVSPGYFREGVAEGEINQPKMKEWAQASMKFLRKTYGDRLLAAVIHLDETTPHIHAYVVPLVEKEVRPRGPRRKNAKEQPKDATMKWVLCCSDLFTPDPYLTAEMGNEIVKVKTGKKGTLSLLHDDYTADLQQAGLDIHRGVRKAPQQKGLEHTKIRDYYASLETEFQQLDEMSPADRKRSLRKVSAALQKAKRLHIQKKHYQEAASHAQTTNKDLEQELVTAKQKLAEMQRSLTVETVIEMLTGVTPRELDPSQCSPESGTKPHGMHLEFRLPTGQRIGIFKGNRFTNLTPEFPFPGEGGKRKTGKGAIDAVTLIAGLPYSKATDWITVNFGIGETKKAVSEKVDVDYQRDIQIPDETQWPAALKTLTNTFRFSPEQINQSHANEWIAANKFGNLIFEKSIFDENLDSSRSGIMVYDIKDLNELILETGNAGLVLDYDMKATHTVFCSSPIDALALKATSEHHSANVITIGKNPDESTLRVIKQILSDHPERTHVAKALTTASKRLVAWLDRVCGDKIRKLPLPQGFQSWMDFHRDAYSNGGEKQPDVECTLKGQSEKTPPNIK